MAVDFTQANDLIKRMLQFQMQDRLGQKRSDRSLAQMREQLAGYERIDILQHQLNLKLAGEKNTFARELATYKAKLDLLQDPSYKSVKARSDIARENGDLAEANRLDAEADSLLQGYSEGAVNLVQNVEDLTPEEFAGVARGAKTTDEAGGLLKSARTARTAEAQRATTERGQDVTTAGQAVTKRGQDITARGQDITLLGKEGKTQEDYQTYILGLKKEANTLLTNILKEPDDYGINAGTGEVFEPDTLNGWQEFWRGDKKRAKLAAFNKETEEELNAGVISRKSIRALMARINKIADKARKGKLTPDEEAFLLSIPELEQAISVGEPTVPLPEEAPVAPTEEQPLTPMEKRQIYIEGLIENGISPEKAERMARRKYGL